MTKRPLNISWAIILTLLAVIGILTAPTFAGDLLVPSVYPTIQGAIDAAVGGDVVIIADGTYTGDGNRDIDFLGKPITVKSENGPENCIIDCNGSDGDEHRGFYFQNNEDANSIIDGLSITNGYASYWPGGGGILCYATSPTIMNCIIRDNYASSGGGLRLRNTTSVIISCSIVNNSSYEGGGISVDRIGSEDYSHITLQNCFISNNSAYNLGFGGGGIFCNGSDISLADSVISNNFASYSGGGILCHISDITLTNCIISNNVSGNNFSSSGIGGAITCSQKSNMTITNCTIVGNTVTDGIFSQDTPVSQGGGLCITNNADSSVVVTNSIITDNRSSNSFF